MSMPSFAHVHVLPGRSWCRTLNMVTVLAVWTPLYLLPDKVRMQKQIRSRFAPPFGPACALWILDGEALDRWLSGDWIDGNQGA